MVGTVVSNLVLLLRSGSINIDRWSLFSLQRTPRSLTQWRQNAPRFQLAAPRLQCLPYSPADVWTSPDLARSLDTHEILDYRDEQVIAQIRHIALDLRYILDTIDHWSGRRSRRRHCDDGGVVCTVRPGNRIRVDYCNGCVGVDCVFERA